ncbi:hypothetical protein [Pseudoalteromonas sp. H105]|jgi:hypothetical protein|uniref:hypothetical protein n=1 Tax=Pseudoalteromonas sp. H105 TaxID=1348393 RepID=UPI00073222EB|nr:hypothetical protein [Pseudoalteromonas sp. H105]KTF15551.1 hypothetical protein ATS75_08375 [Pseudoalteromonas sp. H105]
MTKVYLSLPLFYFLICKLAFASEHFSDHEQYCLSLSTDNCIEHIETALENEPQYTKSWYKLKTLQIDYLYDTLNFDEIIVQVEPLVDLESTPTVFKTQLYFYYAKAISRTDKEQAIIYANKAMAKLENMYSAFENPFRLLELANLHYVFGDKERSYNLLLNIGSRFAKSRDPIFHFELNANKANVFHSWGNLEKALKFRLLALEAIINTDHKSKITLAIGNVARTHQLLANYDSAIKYYGDSFAYMQYPKNTGTHAVYTLRTAEAYWQSKNRDKAAAMLSEVDQTQLKEGHLNLYMKLKKDLN